MKAVILVGGEATRLRPLTLNTPKAMVPVLNMPFMEHVLRHLKEHDVNDIIMTLGNLAQPIENHFGDGSRFGTRLNYTFEDNPLGTAGAVRKASKYLDETFAVLNGDIFTDLNLKEMADFHQRKKAKVTIALTPVEDPTAYGLIETTAEGKVKRFLEKPSPAEITTNMINAGTYIIEPEVLDLIPQDINFSFERQLFPQLLEQEEPVYAFSSSAYWIDIGTPEKYLQLNRDLLQGKSSHHTTSVQQTNTGKGSTINPSAQIKGPVLVGDNCDIEAGARLIGPVVIGSGCTVAQEATIEGSLLWHNISIGQKAEVKGSIIADNCRLGEGSGVAEGSVLGDNVTLATGYRLQPSSRIQPGEKLG